MRTILLVSWLLLPIGAWAYHEGPGQDRVALESTDAVLARAHEAFAKGSFKAAVREYESALKALPKNVDAMPKSAMHRLHIELNKARMQASQLPEARDGLEELVDQMSSEPGTDPAQLAEARQVLARSQFYMTWLMRLEGVDRAEWEPEIEAARQNWRLLAEQAGDASAKAQHTRDLEAAVRLERLDIEDLQGLPIPGE